MGKFGVSLYIKRNISDGNVVVTSSPMYKLLIEADNSIQAALGALKKAKFNEYTTDDLFCIRNRDPGWESYVNIIVRSFDEENKNDSVSYFTIWK